MHENEVGPALRTAKKYADHCDDLTRGACVAHRLCNVGQWCGNCDTMRRRFKTNKAPVGKIGKDYLREEAASINQKVAKKIVEELIQETAK